MRRTVKISPKKSVIKGSLKADFAMFDEQVGAPVFVPQNSISGNVFTVNQYTHLDSDGVTYKPVIMVDNVVEVLQKTRLIISVQVVNPEDQIDIFNVQNIRYKWYKNGSYLYEVNNLNDLKGSTAVQFTEDQCTPAISGIYTVEATNDTGTTVSSELIIRVHDPLNTPELYGNLIFNSSGEADLDGWTAAPGVSVQQFFSEQNDYSYGENASIPRIQKMRLDWQPDEVKVRLTQPTGLFAFRKHPPYSFKGFYDTLQSHVISVGGESNFDPEAFQSELSDWHKWLYRNKIPNLVRNENDGVEWGNPTDFFGSFFPSKDYLDEYNNNVQSSLTAEGILPGWNGHMGTYFTREPIKPNEEGVLKMSQQVDISNIAGFVDGNVCGVDKVVGNLFAYVGTGIDSYNYRVVFDDLHKSVPQNEQLLREIIQKVNTWDADLRYWVDGYDTAWWDRGSRNPIPNIYRALTLKQRSSYMDKIYPTAFDSVGAWEFAKNYDAVNVRLNYRRSSSVSDNGRSLSTGNENQIFNYPQLETTAHYYEDLRNSRRETRGITTNGSSYAGSNSIPTNRHTKHLTQDFGYLDDDWSYTSAPYVHRKDLVSNITTYYIGSLTKGIPDNYTGSWNWFGPPLVYNGSTVTSSINTTADNKYLASGYVITARYLNSLSILTGGRDGDPTTGAIAKIPESSVLNYTNLRYRSGTPVTYQTSVPMQIEGSTGKFIGFVTKSSDWRDFNPPTHTISPNIEENKGTYFYNQRPDAEHPEGHETDPVLLNFLKDRSSLTLGFNSDFFAKAAALVPGGTYGVADGNFSNSSWLENGFYVEKTVGEFEYQPPMWKYPILQKLYETSIGSGYEYSSYLSDFAIIFHRLLMIQNINQAHPEYDRATNRYPIKGAIESDLYLDAISRTIDSARPFTSDQNKINIIRNNQYQNLPYEFKLVSPSLYFQDKYISYVHDKGYGGGRNTCYAPPGNYPDFTADEHLASRDSVLAVDPSLESDITPLPTSGEAYQPYIDRITDALNTRFEDAEDFIMTYIVKRLNDDLFQIPNIEALTQEDLEAPVVKVLISAIHLFSSNRTHLAGGAIIGTATDPLAHFRFQENATIDTNDSYAWYHKQFGSQTFGGIGVNFGKPVGETVVSCYKLFSNQGSGPLQGFYQNLTIVNSQTNQVENAFDNVDASSFNEKTGAKRSDAEIGYQRYSPRVLPTETTGSLRLFEGFLSYPTGAFSFRPQQPIPPLNFASVGTPSPFALLIAAFVNTPGFSTSNVSPLFITALVQLTSAELAVYANYFNQRDSIIAANAAAPTIETQYLGVPEPTNDLGSPGFNLSPISGGSTLNAKASCFPFHPSFDFNNRVIDRPASGISSLQAPLLTYQPYVPTAEIKSALKKEFPMAHAAGGLWYDMSTQQDWHEYIRRALVYWIYVYRGGIFAPETGDTLLMPAAPDIELNTTMLSAEALLRLQKDATGYPLTDYRHILTGVHDNISRQGARIEVTPRADNQVKFVVQYINENQEIIGQDTLSGPTVDDIFAVKEKIFLPTILGSLIQKTCILPDIRPVPVLYKGIEMFSVSNTDIISSAADFIDKFAIDGFLEEHGVSSGATVSEVISADAEERDTDQWKAQYEIVSRLTPDRGAAAFFAIQKKLFLPRGTTSIDVQILFENNSVARNAPIANQGDIKYEADTIPAAHTSYPYMFYEYGYPRTGVCLVKLCLYDNEFKRTRKYPQYYIPTTHVWSSMKQTMATYGPLAYLQGYSVLGRYGQAQQLFESINYRVPDRNDLSRLQQGQRTIRTFVFTPEMQELFRNNGYVVEGEPPTKISKVSAPSEVYDLSTVEGIETVQIIHTGLIAQQQQSALNNGTVTGNPPGYQQIP